MSTNYDHPDSLSYLRAWRATPYRPRQTLCLAIAAPAATALAIVSLGLAAAIASCALADSMDDVGSLRETREWSDILLRHHEYERELVPPIDACIVARSACGCAAIGYGIGASDDSTCCCHTLR